MEITLKKSHLKIAAVSIFLLALIAVAGFFAKDLILTGNVISNNQEIVGETGILYIEGSDVVLLAVTLEDLVELMKSAAEGNQEGYTTVFQDGRAFAVPGGTQAGIVENNAEVSLVQILEGDFEGAYGWLLSEWIVK